MNDLIITGAGCFLLGIMTTMHPCPLATNMAAISLLVGWSKSGQRTFWISVLFMSGYLSVFVILSTLLGTGIISIPAISNFLHKIIPVFLGPVLIITGMLFAELISFNSFYQGLILPRLQSKQGSGSGAFPMGVILALSFCPATAAVFFGLLIPLAAKHGHTILFPTLYAAGASLPLIGISLMIHHGTKIKLNQDRQKKIMAIAGWVLIFIGVIISIQQIYIR